MSKEFHPVTPVTSQEPYAGMQQVGRLRRKVKVDIRSNVYNLMLEPHHRSLPLVLRRPSAPRPHVSPVPKLRPVGEQQKHFHAPLSAQCQKVRPHPIHRGTQLCYFTESQNVQGWKGPLWVIWSNTPAKAGSPRAGCTGPRPGRS